MLSEPIRFLHTVPKLPGVYKMLDASPTIIYIGKAKNLRKRLASYFRKNLAPKTAACMAQVATIQFTITNNETEALLLEYRLIKQYRPRYNIIFRDNKSYPYLMLSRHVFPRLMLYRGAIDATRGDFFGPFPDLSALNFVLKLVQRLFKLRVCQDTAFRHRSRPCLLQQLKLCSAPCRQFITPEKYAEEVELAKRFLHGDTQQVVQQITTKMEQAAHNLAYEAAAEYRDQIMQIRKLTMEQPLAHELTNADIIFVAQQENLLVIQQLFIRSSWLIGSKNFNFVIAELLETPAELLTNFILVNYLKDNYTLELPEQIILNMEPSSSCVELAQFLSKHFLRTITLKIINAADSSFGLMQLAQTEAQKSILQQTNKLQRYATGIQELSTILNLLSPCKRIDCFDASHYQGEAQLVAAVSFDQQGPCQRLYRRINMQTERPGDDYAALAYALKKRYQKARELPDIIVVDGGKGQLAAAAAVLVELQLTAIPLLAIAKGEKRREGNETIYLWGQEEPLALTLQNAAFKLLIQLRDEAHRFAIMGQRRKLRQRRFTSQLDAIPGIGRQRRLAILKYFGGYEALMRVSVHEIAQVPGISIRLAQLIYSNLHA